MNKPQISQFSNPADFARACEAYMKSLNADPGESSGKRTDADDRADATDDPTPVLANFANPADYVKACQEHLARRLDGRAHTVPKRGHRDDAADRAPVRRTGWGEE